MLHNRTLIGDWNDITFMQLCNKSTAFLIIINEEALRSGGTIQPKGAQYCTNRRPFAGSVFGMALSRS
jgi:hypothetical protein